MKSVTTFSFVLLSSLGSLAQSQKASASDSASFYYYADQDNSVRIEKLTITSKMKLHWYTALISKADGQIELLADLCSTMVPAAGKYIVGSEPQGYFNSRLWSYPDGTEIYFPSFEKIVSMKNFTLPMYPNGIGGNKLSQSLEQSSIIDITKVPGLSKCQD